VKLKSIFDREKLADTSTRKRYAATFSYRSSKSEKGERA